MSSLDPFNHSITRAFYWRTVRWLLLLRHPQRRPAMDHAMAEADQSNGVEQANRQPGECPPGLPHGRARPKQPRAACSRLR